MGWREGANPPKAWKWGMAPGNWGLLAQLSQGIRLCPSGVRGQMEIRPRNSAGWPPTAQCGEGSWTGGPSDLHALIGAKKGEDKERPRNTDRQGWERPMWKRQGGREMKQPPGECGHLIQLLTCLWRLSCVSSAWALTLCVHAHVRTVCPRRRPGCRCRPGARMEPAGGDRTHTHPVRPHSPFLSSQCAGVASSVDFAPTPTPCPCRPQSPFQDTGSQRPGWGPQN